MTRFRFGRSQAGWFGWRRVGRPVDLAVALGILGLLAVAGAVLQYRLGPARELVGVARVIDGDSLRINGEELRLEGLDAPELRQNCADKAGRLIECGRLARRALEILLNGAPVTCQIGKADRYGRGLARCRVGHIDVNAAMVRQGHAVAYGGYRGEEAQARAESLGLWALSFERPETWRRQHAR